MKSAPIAFSYIRFSSLEQAKGDSLRRQTESTREWCERNGIRLDESTTLHDLGRSAYTGKHRENPDRNALAAFLKLVESGKVPRGSYLVLENLDRLSREHIQPALLLALNLLQAGIRIVQLKPAEMVFDDKSDTLPVMMMMMELSRGHGESAMKSERVGKAWREKKQAARDSGEVLTRQLPFWVEARDGKFYLIPERAAAVRRIFSLAANGYGLTAIVKRLTEDGVPAFGKTGQWDRGYVSKILRGREAVGEYQPRRGSRRGIDGEPIANYFPAVVTEAEWLAARAGAAQRRAVLDKNGKYQKGRKNCFGGRNGMRVNVFAGLLHNARDGGSYYAGMKNPGSLMLMNKSIADGQKGYYFPFTVFEQAMLSLLKEVDPREVLGQDSGADELQVLEGKWAQAKALLDGVNVELNAGGNSPTLYALARAREAALEELTGQLNEARQRVANPLSAAWDEAKTVMAALDSAPDPRDARLRLRSLLRRTVESIHLLVVPVARQDRLAAVRVQFVGTGKHRDYAIFSRTFCGSGKYRKPHKWWAKSLADVAALGDLDLRKQKDAKKLEAALAALDLDAAAGE
jgi:DNA invertase Pin-like site-specific DNA recombinase